MVDVIVTYGLGFALLGFVLYATVWMIRDAKVNGFLPTGSSMPGETDETQVK